MRRSKGSPSLSQPNDDKNDDAALRKRLDSLSKSLDTETPVPVEKTTSDATSMATAMSLGVRVLTEFVAGVVVGAVIGWQLDKWFHTSPILLIVFLTLGTAAGFWNVYRFAAKPADRGRRSPPL